MKEATKTLVLILLLVAIVIFPLVVNSGAEYGGADGQAEEMITEIQQDYEPWFESLWEPPSGEIESMLFSLQAAGGAGLLCYYIGYIRGKKRRLAETDAH